MASLSSSSESSPLIQRTQTNPKSPKTLEVERETSPKPKPTTQSTPSQTVSQQILALFAHLANLLPTGTLLAFQLLTPVVTQNGSCDQVTGLLTRVVLTVLGLSCLGASFTDSWRSPQDNQVYYGFITTRGMWLFQYPDGDYPVPDLSKYKLRFIDMVHAVLSMLVFVTVVARDKNVISCFDPNPTQEAQEILDIIPICIGLVCSFLYSVFPYKRHGIGYPVTNGNN